MRPALWRVMSRWRPVAADLVSALYVFGLALRSESLLAGGVYAQHLMYAAAGLAGARPH